MTNPEIFANPEAFHKSLSELQNNKDEAVTEEVKEEVAPDHQEETPNDTPEDDNTSEESVNEEDSSADETSDDNDDDYPSKKDYNIPKSRFNKEIEKRKALEAELQKEREDKIRFEEKLKYLTELEEKQKATQQQEPELLQEEVIDPLDAESHNLYMKRISDLENRLNQLNNTTQETTQNQRVYNAVTTQEEVFSKLNPDYQDAVNHLINLEKEVAMNFVGEEEAAKVVEQKLKTLVKAGLAQNKNIPEMFYGMAKKYGFQAKPKAPSSNTSNIESINRNMDKSANTSNLGNTASLKGSGNLVKGTSMLKDPKSTFSGVDPDKFHKMLSKIQRT
jgi:hypothetical protein